VLSWQAQASGVSVQTPSGRYEANRLVLTAGPWAGQLLQRWGTPLRVMRQVPLWFGTREVRRFCRDVFPLYIVETAEGHFYGFPALDADGVKVARHYGAPELLDPAGVERTVSARDEEPVRQFLRAYLPEVDGPRRRASVCIYTLTPDRHFILDVHPEHANVVLAAGFSGHGFKFAPVVGEILADLSEKGRTPWPIGLFRIGRFANREDILATDGTRIEHG
jgi:sarcosine oxidase